MSDDENQNFVEMGSKIAESKPINKFYFYAIIFFSALFLLILIGGILYLAVGKPLSSVQIISNAVENSNPIYCKTLNGSIKNSCYLITSYKSQNDSACSDIDSKDLKNSCNKYLGSVQGIKEINTSKSAWFISEVPVNTSSNIIRFDYEFIKNGSSNALLLVFFDDQLIFEKREQDSKSDVFLNSGYLPLNKDYEYGNYTLMFITIPLTDVPAKAVIDNFQFGFSNNSEKELELGRLDDVWKRSTKVYPITLEGVASNSVGYSNGILTTPRNLTNLSSAWISSGVQIDNPVNSIAFQTDFLSNNGSEGLLSVWWDYNLVTTVDERYGYEGEIYLMELPSNVPLPYNSSDISAVQDLIINHPDEYYNSLETQASQPGTHILSFELTPYTQIPSSVKIFNLSLYYINQTIIGREYWGEVNSKNYSSAVSAYNSDEGYISDYAILSAPIYVNAYMANSSGIYIELSNKGSEEITLTSLTIPSENCTANLGNSGILIPSFGNYTTYRIIKLICKDTLIPRNNLKGDLIAEFSKSGQNGLKSTGSISVKVV